MSVFKKLKSAKLAWVLICVLLSLCSSLSLQAHVLTETSAQVILRDGQVEIKILTNIEHLLSTLQSEQAWLLGDIDSVMPENLSLNQQAEFIKNALKQKMHLTVNDKDISVEAVIFENGSHNLAHSTVKSTEIVFQARHSFAQVTALSISFPKSLGAVHTSFVKPQYKLLNVGDIAHIVF